VIVEYVRTMSIKLNPDIASVRLSAEDITSRVTELAQQLSRDYAGKDVVLIGVLTGSAIFIADLVRAMSIPVSFDFLAVGSYGPDAKISGVVKILKDLDSPVESRHVVLVEDVLNPAMARRAEYLAEVMRARRVASVRICTLLDKPDARAKAGVTVKPDYCGFTLDEAYVVGYGLDYLGNYRALPYIGVLKPEIYGGG